MANNSQAYVYLPTCPEYIIKNLCPFNEFPNTSLILHKPQRFCFLQIKATLKQNAKFLLQKLYLLVFQISGETWIYVTITVRHIFRTKKNSQIIIRLKNHWNFCGKHARLVKKPKGMTHSLLRMRVRIFSLCGMVERPREVDVKMIHSIVRGELPGPGWR